MSTDEGAGRDGSLAERDESPAERAEVPAEPDGAPADRDGTPADRDGTPAERHRRHAGTFTARVEGARDWNVPSPVEAWTARDVVRHLVEWFPGFLEAGAGVRLEPGPSVDEDPVAAWRAQADGVQALLDDPVTAERTLSNPHLGELPLDEAIDRFYTPDVFMHTWDLARATGQDDRLDPELCAEMVAGMEPMQEMLEASGQYGPRVPVPEDADAQTRLLGLIGRDPHWEPPGR